MTETTTRHWSPVTMLVGLIIVGEAVALLVGALLHVGVQIPVGGMVLAEPRILPATVVEGVTGLMLAGSAYAVVARKPWAWTAVVAAQLIALCGVLLGMVALAVGAGPSTASNALFHRVMLVVLIGSLLFLLIPRIRAAFGREKRAS